MISKRFILLSLLGVLVVQAQTAQDQSLEARRNALKELLAEQWEYTTRTSPEFASMLGDKRYNDQLTDYSISAIQQRYEAARRFLGRFEAIDTTGFPEQESLNKRLMVHDLKSGLEGERFKTWEMPVTQQSGIHLEAPQAPSVFPFQTTKDYRDFITRLHKLPTTFDQTIALMRAGEKDGLMPPKFLLEKVAAQCERIASTPAAESPFAEPLKHFPDAVPAPERGSIHDDLLAAVAQDIIPAYKKFGDFVRNEYAPKGRSEPGVWSLPDGEALYSFMVRNSTTTDLTPEQIHELGKQQVDEIEQAELGVAKRLGFADVKSLRESVNKDPNLHPKSGDEILDLYRKYVDQMYGKLSELFTKTPKARMIVAPTEAFRAKEAAAAEYVQGTPDGSRPGRVEVNTSDFAKRTTLEIESTAYHEGIPGHHMQIALAQELTALPPFRQQEYFTAYTEGWALYAERLGKEVGFYQDPYSEYGRLESEMLRAIRLVVDTGIHYKRWSRQQVVDYFHVHSNTDEPEVQSETDRYIAWPSQALGYKIGQLTILRLRDKAKRELGSKFDLRLFHDEVLAAGALPMDVLAERIDAWIADQKSANRAPSSGL